MTAAKFISDLVARGRYCFGTAEAVDALGTTVVAARAALRRLRQKGELATPYKGFYVIVSPEFRNAGCLPASHFIPSLMEHMGEKYYAGLLSAAEYHGAAHQRHPVAVDQLETRCLRGGAPVEGGQAEIARRAQAHLAGTRKDSFGEFPRPTEDA